MKDILPLEEHYAYKFILNNPNVTQAGVVMNADYDFRSSNLAFYPNAVVYKIWYNSSAPANVFVLNPLPNDVDFRLEVQKSIDAALLQQKTALNVSINSAKKDYPSVINNYNREYVLTYTLIPILFGTHFFSIIACLYEINTDREKKLRQGLTMVGMKEFPYWAHWFLSQMIFSAISSLFIVIVGKRTKISFFILSDFMVLFLTFWCYGMSSFPMAFILSTFAKNPVKANAFAAVLFLLLFGLIITFVEDGSTGLQLLEVPFLGFILALFPSVDFGQICAGIHQRSTLVQNTTSSEWSNGPGFKWNDLYKQPTIYLSRTNSSGFGYMFLAMFFWTLLAWYLDNVLSGEDGLKKPPYFLLLPQYWGCDKSPPNVAIYKHNIHKISSVLPDMDKDILLEHQAAMAMAQTGKSGIVILKLSKTYEGGARALDNLTVYSEAGNVLCLLGHNGAGKTTAISVLTGLYKATSGDALIFGDSVVFEMDSIRKLMGVCSQHDILWDKLTAREHINLFAKMKAISMSKRDIKDQLREVHLETVADHQTSTFSGGMKRRLSVAIANIGDPKVIFMDEPTSGLDPRSRIQLAELIRKIKKNRVIVLTTQSMEEADLLADKIAILALGRLRAVGDSLHLKTRFGEGYHINLVCEMNNLEEVLEVISVKFPNAKLAIQSAGNLVYTIPYTNYNEVSSFIEWIEQEVHYITDWGLSHTTLEEVFLRIVHGAAEGEHVIDMVIKLEEMPDAIGTISVTNKTTLAQARHLIYGIPSAPLFYCFLSSPETPIPWNQENLKCAALYGPSITLRPLDEKKVENMQRHDIDKDTVDAAVAHRIKHLEEENDALKERVRELEHLLINTK